MHAHRMLQKRAHHRGGGHCLGVVDQAGALGCGSSLGLVDQLGCPGCMRQARCKRLQACRLLLNGCMG